jgi:hypothetical protein
MERINLKQLNEVEHKEQYRAVVSNRFAVLSDLDTGVDTNSALERIQKFQPKKV